MKLSITRYLFIFIFLFVAMPGCKPKEDVELRKIRDIIVDATSDPLLRANAILYNPNNIRMRLRKIDVEIFVNDKKAGVVDQELKMQIPAQKEFTIPLEVKLNMKELGVFDTLLGMIGGKKLKVHYKGHISISYKGIPVRVPVDYKDEIRISF